MERAHQHNHDRRGHGSEPANAPCPLGLLANKGKAERRHKSERRSDGEILPAVPTEECDRSEDHDGQEREDDRGDTRSRAEPEPIAPHQDGKAALERHRHGGVTAHRKSLRFEQSNRENGGAYADGPRQCERTPPPERKKDAHRDSRRRKRHEFAKIRYEVCDRGERRVHHGWMNTAARRVSLAAAMPLPKPQETLRNPVFPLPALP